MVPFLSPRAWYVRLKPELPGPFPGFLLDKFRGHTGLLLKIDTSARTPTGHISVAFLDDTAEAHYREFHVHASWFEKVAPDDVSISDLTGFEQHIPNYTALNPGYDEHAGKPSDPFAHEWGEWWKGRGTRPPALTLPPPRPEDQDEITSIAAQ